MEYPSTKPQKSENTRSEMNYIRIRKKQDSYTPIQTIEINEKLLHLGHPQ